jgi:hypothetical protein
MNTYRIRFNKTRGQAGRGTMEHVWRVFEGDKEYLFKNLNITVPVKSEKDANGVDYNIVCKGFLTPDRATSTAVIDAPVDKAAWTTYRQELRDVTKQSGFPWTIDWPLLIS